MHMGKLTAKPPHDGDKYSGPMVPASHTGSIDGPMLARLHAVNVP